MQRMQRRRRINHGAGAEKVGDLRSGLGQKGGLVCMCVCVRHAQKIAKHAVFFLIKYFIQKII